MHLKQWQRRTKVRLKGIKNLNANRRDLLFCRLEEVML